jgi:hypothetical protein
MQKMKKKAFLPLLIIVKFTILQFIELYCLAILKSRGKLSDNKFFSSGRGINPAAFGKEN